MNELTENDITFVPRGFVPGVKPRRGSSYSELEKQFIRDHYMKMTDKEVGDALGRSGQGAGHIRKKMGLSKFDRRDWTEEEEQILSDNYADTPIGELEKLLPRWSRETIYSHAHLMGLKKDEDYMEEIQKENGKRLCELGVNNQFEKGHTPYNKGMKQEEYMTPEMIERTKATRFKKGHKPWNMKYDGAVTIRHAHEERGEPPYMWIRIAKGDWMLYHRHLWEQEHGSIPDKHILRCKSGNTLDPRPENWEMITMAENVRRNHNPEKVSKAMKEYWANNPHPARDLTDKYVAGLLAGGDHELRDYILRERKDMIKVARANYKLQRQINNYDGSEEETKTTEN